MSHLRSRLLIVLVSLLVFTGYAHAMMDKCCEEASAKWSEHGTSDPADDGGCHCLCHKIFSNAFTVPAQLPAVILVLQRVRLPAGEFPPDTDPEGIDYPPQLA